VHTYNIVVIGHTDFRIYPSPVIMSGCIIQCQGLALIIAKILSSVMRRANWVRDVNRQPNIAALACAFLHVCTLRRQLRVITGVKRFIDRLQSLLNFPLIMLHV
jgi:hypothetical protein